ncbi:hypothetical protein B0W47_01985 [Komagataeibacter nataicola]|uniref:Uncharacterized protein n=1 Tax=Komagataeibacter nataicola TaxID=265960 RepID=A0A9N7CAT9_9PROT|nr:hypothetical protein [Komagataeibacter nataicola]AQU86424.1 hypothetical protein B0W47_01985 [Komagataeibacter nataicola]PYD65301.1 hypothetical protein CDI09_14325 [Komagataeibacter nataicola]WEQ56681.1 hypothetical protein LV564_06290 [Komagataeibacter nataicola]WNM08152.1 hypothetical protein RI056_14785 [Komagataeibacter nataicola]GBR15545.1 hypothetical protein AA0616_0582 [Komagataeibacter nataicola NRIC 0616]
MEKTYVHGGSVVKELGFPSDLELFFRCIKFFVADECPDHKFILVLDNLYRRYVPLIRTQELREEFDAIETIFKRKKSKEIDWKSFPNGDIEKTELNPRSETLYTLFERFFIGFNVAINNGFSFYKKYNKDKPIFISKGIFSASFVIGRDRGSDKIIKEKYDNLTGHPLWW